MRPHAGSAADAGDRPGVLLVVPVALAGAGARSAVAGHPLGLAGKLVAVLVSGGLAVLTLRFIENPLRFAAPVRRSALASLALGGAATAMAVAVGVALLGSIPVPVGAARQSRRCPSPHRRLPQAPLSTPTTRRCSRRSRRFRRRS